MPDLQLQQGESFTQKILALMKKRDKKLKRMAYGAGSNVIFLTYSHAQKNYVESYKYHKSLKWLKNEQRILDVEKNCLVPLVFSCMAGVETSARHTIKQLASKVLGRNNLHKHEFRFCTSVHRYHMPTRMLLFQTDN